MTNENNDLEIKKIALTIAWDMVKTFTYGKNPQTDPIDQKISDMFDTAKKIERYFNA